MNRSVLIKKEDQIEMFLQVKVVLEWQERKRINLLRLKQDEEPLALS